MAISDTTLSTLPHEHLVSPVQVHRVATWSFGRSFAPLLLGRPIALPGARDEATIFQVSVYAFRVPFCCNDHRSTTDFGAYAANWDNHRHRTRCERRRCSRG